MKSSCNTQCSAMEQAKKDPIKKFTSVKNTVKTEAPNVYWKMAEGHLKQCQELGKEFGLSIKSRLSIPTPNNIPLNRDKDPMQALMDKYK